jgi:hypothetical protein
MGWIWWVLGLSCGGLVLLALAGLVYLVIRDHQIAKRVIAEGEHTTGWLVQANVKLFQNGIVDLPALVLLSPDKAVANDKELLTDLAERIMELKGTDPADCDDKDDAFVSELMRDEKYIEGKRDLLPKGFAQGRVVYLAHLYVYRDHLPGKRVTGHQLPCAVVWDDLKLPICTRPPTQGDRRREEEDDT